MKMKRPTWMKRPTLMEQPVIIIESGSRFLEVDEAPHPYGTTRNYYRIWV
jgi:hypothetical protein